MNKEISAEDLLKQLYNRSMVCNCTEYLEGLEKHPPDGYADESLKEYWDKAIKLILQAEKQARLDGIKKCVEVARKLSYKKTDPWNTPNQIDIQWEVSKDATDIVQALQSLIQSKEEPKK